MQTITVPLGERSYPIHIERGLLAKTGAMIREKLGDIAIAVVSDDHVAPLYMEEVVSSMEKVGLRVCSIVLPHGEQTKCLKSLETLYAFLCEHHLTRKDAIVALGGGVIGDLAGLAAATYLRGDLPQGKNLVGAFYQPELVLVDPDSLRTLTDDFWRDGLGEVVKYGCIGDEALFRLLEENAGGGRIALMGVIGEILTHCIQYKANIVAQDEHDTGLRMTLNFGHTIAHAVETCQHYTGMRHGEAVALGMRVITAMTEEKGMTEQGTSARLNRLLDALGMPRQLPAIPEKDLLNAMTLDKKSAGKQLRVITLDKIGVCRIVPTDVDFFQGMTAQKFVQN